MIAKILKKGLKQLKQVYNSYQIAQFFILWEFIFLFHFQIVKRSVFQKVEQKRNNLETFKRNLIFKLALMKINCPYEIFSDKKSRDLLDLAVFATMLAPHFICFLFMRIKLPNNKTSFKNDRNSKNSNL